MVLITSVIKRSAKPRRPRVIVINTPHHIIQRGNDGQACFYANEEYRFYLEWLNEYVDKTEYPTHTYVLMTNYVHLIVSTEKVKVIAALLKTLGEGYTQ